MEFGHKSAKYLSQDSVSRTSTLSRHGIIKLSQPVCNRLRSDKKIIRPRTRRVLERIIFSSVNRMRSTRCGLLLKESQALRLIIYKGKLTNRLKLLLTRKASCRWQTIATLAKRLHGLCKSSGVVSCIASLPIDSLPMVSYYCPTVTLSKTHRFRDMTTYWSKIAEKTYPTLIWHVPLGWLLANFSTTHTLPETRIMRLSDGAHFTILLSLC